MVYAKFGEQAKCIMGNVTRPDIMYSDVFCSDIDECQASPAVCHVNANCVNNIGSPDNCTCKTGFSGNGRNCFGKY